MVTRRDFLKITGTAAGTAAAALAGVEKAHARPDLDPDRLGVLCDTTLCVGCRKCEWACADSNGLPHGDLASYAPGLGRARRIFSRVRSSRPRK